MSKVFRPADGRSECRRHDCREPDPKFPVTWRCEAGHRETAWYCAGHGPQMMMLALEAAREDAGLICTECSPHVLMKPAAETVIL